MFTKLLGKCWESIKHNWYRLMITTLLVVIVILLLDMKATSDKNFNQMSHLIIGYGIKMDNTNIELKLDDIESTNTDIESKLDDVESTLENIDSTLLLSR